MAFSLTKIKVAVCMFSGADLLDFCGPVEILSQAVYNQDRNARAFEVIPIANTETIRSAGVLTVKPDITFAEASKRIDEFDILVAPGGEPDLLQGMATSNGPEVQFIKAFNALGQKGGKERIILSVCTGALLVAATGALKGMRASTHHWALGLLGRIDGSIDVVSHTAHDVDRYVDGGLNENGVRMVTAGGVSCGLDASFHIVELKAGKEVAEFAASMAEYEWKRA